MELIYDGTIFWDGGHPSLLNGCDRRWDLRHVRLIFTAMAEGRVISSQEKIKIFRTGTH